MHRTNNAHSGRFATPKWPHACLLAGTLTLTACSDKAAPPPAPTTPQAAPAAPTKPAPVTLPPQAPAVVAPAATSSTNLAGMISTDNAWCPIMPKKAIEPQMPREWTRQLDGKTIGFCCDECMGYWDTLDPQQQTEKLTDLMRSTSPAPAVTPVTSTPGR